MKKILTFMLFISLFSLFGCSKNKGFTKTIYVFDTTVTINLYEGEESNLDDIIDILNYYHKLTDAYHTYDGITNVKKVNDEIKSGQTDLVISKDLASVLDIPIGIVNILGSFLQIDKSIMLGIGDLTNLWKEAISKMQLPNEDTINQVVQDIKDGKYNYIDKNGKLLIPSLWFDEVYDFENGYAGVKKDGKWNYINTEGQLLSPNLWFDGSDYS